MSERDIAERLTQLIEDPTVDTGWRMKQRETDSHKTYTLLEMEDDDGQKILFGKEQIEQMFKELNDIFPEGYKRYVGNTICAFYTPRVQIMFISPDTVNFQGEVHFMELSQEFLDDLYKKK